MVPALGKSLQILITSLKLLSCHLSDYLLKKVIILLVTFKSLSKIPVNPQNGKFSLKYCLFYTLISINFPSKRGKTHNILWAAPSAPSPILTSYFPSYRYFAPVLTPNSFITVPLFNLLPHMCFLLCHPPVCVTETFISS